MAHVNINRVVMTGNLTSDAELRCFPSGARLATFRIACNGLRDDVNFFGVDLWGDRAEKLAEHLTTGRAIAIDGRLQSKEWEASDGSKRYETRIVVDTLEFLDSRREETPESPTTGQRGRASGTRSAARTAGRGGSAAKGGTGTTGRTGRATRGSTRSKA